MKKILGLVLALVLLVSVLAILPVAAEGDGSYLYLDDGITFVNVSGNTETRIPVAAKEIATKPDANKTVQDCLNDYINGDYPQVTKDIAKELLDYCTAAYDYFSTKSEKPYVGTRPNGEPETDASELINAPAPEVIIDDTDDVYLGAALVLDGNMKLRFYFNGNNVNVEHDGNSSVTPADGYCYYDVAVMPFDMDKSVELTVGNTKIKYAPINYLKAKVNDDDLKEIVASIYAYGDAAEKYIREVCQHGDDYIKLDIVKPATLFTKGEANTVCDRCGQTIRTDKSIGTPKTEHYTSEEHGLFGEKVELSTLLGAGEHFYGEDAKKLYVEFSLLWNPSLENYARENNENYMYMGMFGTANGNSVSGYQTAYHLTFGENCKGFDCTWIGGFEPTSYSYNVGNGPSMQPGNKDNFIYIGNYGWHRIGYEFEQTTDPETGLHTITVHLYVDGTRVSGYKVIRDKDNSYQNLLYTADVVDGEIVYTGDVKSGVYMWAFELANGGKANGDMYFAYADVFVTAGNGFVMPVEKVSNPKYATYTVDTNVTFNASTYFKPVGLDTCAHENTMAGVTTTAPTLFATGVATAICTDCGKTTDGTVTLPKLEGTAVETFTPGANVKDIFGAKVNIVNDVLKGDHFYPTEENPDGKSMYVEFSLLWNETLANVRNGDDRYVQLGVLGDETASSVDGDTGRRLTSYFILFVDDIGSSMWCQFAGGFETDNNTTILPEYPQVPDASTNRDDYAFIGNYGWHRIGIEYTQTTKIVSNKVEYTLYTNLYVDGVKKMSYKAIYSDKLFKYKDNLLYTYDVNTGEYTDIASDRYVYAYRFGISHEANDEAAYFVVKDASITCGTDFVMNVAPNDNPENASFTKDGITLPGKQYFDEVVIDCENGIHAWASEYTVDVAPTCTTEGSKSIHCLACGKSDSTTVEPVEALGHTWDTKYTVDKAVTCLSDGQESIKCTVCTTINPDEIRIIKSAGQHVLEDGYTVAVVPTVFAEGLGIGTCTVCHEDDAEAAIDKTEMTLHTYTYTGAGKAEPHYKTGNIGEALGSKEFGPGNDLYLEFSVLLNNTTDILNGEAFGFGHLALNGNLETKKFSWFHYRPQKQWCSMKGGFDFSELNKITYGPQYEEYGSEENYTLVRPYEGWHRFGLQYTQNVYENNGEFTYDVTVTVYVDGVMVTEAIMNWGPMFYSAKREGDEIVYTQNPDIGKYDAVYYNIASGYIKNEGDPDAYFPFGDFSLTVGDSFAMPVAPVENPERATFTPAEGAAPMDSTVHFELRYQSDCLAGNHTYTGKFTVDYDATCVEDGQKSYKCEVCGNVKTEVIESAGQHVWVDDGVTVTVPTVFSEGKQQGTCSICGETDYKDIATTPVTMKTFTSSSSKDKFYEREKLSDVIVEGGQDLYVEFSILYNSTFTKFAGKKCIYTGMFAGSDGSTNRITPYHLVLGSISGWWCQHVGGFEPDNNDKENVVYGPTMVGNGSVDKFPNIYEKYGWHRIGLRYHQTTNMETGLHTITVYLYIDGVYTSAFKMVRDVDNTYQNLLYTANVVGDELVYTDDFKEKESYIYYFMLDSNRASGGNMYFAYADMHITAGPAADNYSVAEMEKYEGFVVPVESVKNPTETTGKIQGVELPTTEYFKVKSN